MGATWGAVVFATAVGAWEATWAEATEGATENDSATSSSAEMGSWYFIFPRLPILSKTESEKKGERSSLPPLWYANFYWNTVVTLLVLLPSFDSPKWH